MQPIIPRAKPNKGSLNDRLLSLDVGARLYIDTTLAKYPVVMRAANTPKSRRPAALKAYEFSTSLFTAVSSSRAGDVRYLICVERAR